MITLEIPDIKRKLYLPSDLSDCDAKQYANVSELIFKYQSGEITYDEFRVLALYRLLDMEPVINEDDEAQIEKMANIYIISHQIDSFFTFDEDGKKTLKQEYTNNPMQIVKLDKVNFHGPSNHFDNVQFGEYVDGLHFFTEYHETQDLHYLYLLMATFYREKDPKALDDDTDVRVEALTGRIEARAEKFKKLPFGQVYGFFLLFASFQKYLVTAKLYWQGKEISLDILFDQKTETTDQPEAIPGLGMKSILYTLAESGVFGVLKELRKESFWEIIFRMYDLVKRDADTKAKTKK
jgi:hypothetical protein